MEFLFVVFIVLWFLGGAAVYAGFATDVPRPIIVFLILVLFWPFIVFFALISVAIEKIIGR